MFISVYDLENKKNGVKCAVNLAGNLLSKNNKLKVLLVEGAGPSYIKPRLNQIKPRNSKYGLCSFLTGKVDIKDCIDEIGNDLYSFDLLSMEEKLDFLPHESLPTVYKEIFDMYEQLNQKYDFVLIDDSEENRDLTEIFSTFTRVHLLPIPTNSKGIELLAEEFVNFSNNLAKELDLTEYHFVSLPINYDGKIFAHNKVLSQLKKMETNRFIVNEPIKINSDFNNTFKNGSLSKLTELLFYYNS